MSESWSQICKQVPPQGTNVSHLWERKILFKSTLLGNMLVPRRVSVLQNMLLGTFQLTISTATTAEPSVNQCKSHICLATATQSKKQCCLCTDLIAKDQGFDDDLTHMAISIVGVGWQWSHRNPYQHSWVAGTHMVAVAFLKTQTLQVKRTCAPCISSPRSWSCQSWAVGPAFPSGNVPKRQQSTATSWHQLSLQRSGIQAKVALVIPKIPWDTRSVSIFALKDSKSWNESSAVIPSQFTKVLGAILACLMGRKAKEGLSFSDVAASVKATICSETRFPFWRTKTSDKILPKKRPQPFSCKFFMDSSRPVLLGYTNLCDLWSCDRFKQPYQRANWLET